MTSQIGSLQIRFVHKRWLGKKQIKPVCPWKTIGVASTINIEKNGVLLWLLVQFVDKRWR